MNYYPVTDGRTDRQTDRKRCIWAHHAICTGGLKKGASASWQVRWVNVSTCHFTNINVNVHPGDCPVLLIASNFGPFGPLFPIKWQSCYWVQRKNNKKQQNNNNKCSERLRHFNDHQGWPLVNHISVLKPWFPFKATNGGIVHLRLTFSYVFFGILVMKELYLGSKILDFFIKFKDLLGSNLNLATPSLSFFWHSHHW